MSKNYSEKIASLADEIAELESRRKELIAAQKEYERKAKTKRLSERGGTVESLLPETVSLTKTQFESFIKRTLLTDFAKRELSKIAAQQPATVKGETTCKNSAEINLSTSV